MQCHTANLALPDVTWLFFASNLVLYTEFIMADGSGKPRYENMKTRRVRIECNFNMALPHADTISTPVLLTENDIPGASLEGRKPAELKKADLLFWLRCRGDSCKGLNVKARFVKRYVQRSINVNIRCFV